MADSSDDIPLWLIVGAALIFPFLFVFGALILGAGKLGQWAGERIRAIGHTVTTLKRLASSASITDGRRSPAPAPGPLSARRP